MLLNQTSGYAVADIALCTVRKAGYQKELPREARGNLKHAPVSDSAKKALTFGLVGLVLFGS